GHRLNSSTPSRPRVANRGPPAPSTSGSERGGESFPVTDKQTRAPRVCHYPGAAPTKQANCWGKVARGGDWRKWGGNSARAGSRGVRCEIRTSFRYPRQDGHDDRLLLLKPVAAE